MHRRLIFQGCVGAIGLLLAGATQARECNGAFFPEQLQSEAGTLVLNGLGMRQATLFKVNVYVSALYLPKPSADARAILESAAPYELVMAFVRNVGAKDIANGWSEGFERNGREQLPALSGRIATLTGWMSDIKTGQRMQFTFRPGVGLQAIINGTPKGTITGDDFGRAFLSIWLGVPPNPEIKAGMLGGPCS